MLKSGDMRKDAIAERFEQTLREAFRLSTKSLQDVLPQRPKTHWRRKDRCLADKAKFQTLAP
ncbi:hypothetical protein SAMN05444161_6820 [Rhizobiales bacterium GAS191]|nr:hypothetical protein SAMN05444161_6820 [Rhizobiales bacterium GAS191]